LNMYADEHKHGEERASRCESLRAFDPA